mgnify:CR=1 FL=1|tara:strand:- start:1395 stop:2057 length:663 start_codon:yes stop_codon:yes gene_type:complete
MSILNFLHSGGNKVSLTTPASNPASDLTLKLPQADGSSGQFLKTDGSGALSFATPTPTYGLSMADQWRWTTEFTQSNNQSYLTTTSNWERPDSKLGIGSNPLGTGMTQSGGQFTFPSTGYYLIDFFASAKVANDSCETFVFIQGTENNSSYTDIARALFTIQNQCTPNFGTGSVQYLARITDTSNHKVRFRLSNSGISVTWLGASDENRIAATFLKIGEI